MSDTGYYFLPTGTLHQKPEISRLKNFCVGYVDSFYRNLADNVDTFLGSDFYGRIAKDADLPSEHVQKYILATSDFAKGTQTDINHYVTRDRINNASFRQRLDPISKNILWRQNPLELVFEDISIFDAENPIVDSLLREIDVKKKGTDSDLIKNLPNQPGKEFEIRKRLDRLKGIKRFPKDNNNNNNDNNDNFPPPVVPISRPYIDPFPSPGPGPAPGSGPGFSLSSINLFQPPPAPPSTDAFSSRGRYDLPPTLSFNNFQNFNYGAQPSSFTKKKILITNLLLLVYLAHKQLPSRDKKKTFPLKMT